MSSVIDNIVFKRAVKIFLFAISITIIATIITYLINPDIQKVIDGVDSNLSDNDQINESTGIHKIWLYIVNNGFVVPLQMLILAIVPIQFLYMINIISTVSLTGILFGVALQADPLKGLKIIISTIPHYVFEVFAFCLLAALLFELNKVVRTKIKNVFKKEKERVSFIKRTLGTVISYAILILPLIIVAAFLETYIADIIFNLL